MHTQTQNMKPRKQPKKEDKPEVIFERVRGSRGCAEGEFKQREQPVRVDHVVRRTELLCTRATVPQHNSTGREKMRVCMAKRGKEGTG